MHTGEAIIHLADSRACVQNNSFRSYQTSVVSDETLAARAHIEHSNNSTTLTIPLVGEVVCNSERISPGQAMVFRGDVVIANPYEKELINYLIIKTDVEESLGILSFDLDSNINTLRPVVESIQIGKFNGRQDSIYKPATGANGVLVFVIEGAFEAQNRLLHPRDGLTLLNATEVELEALSNEAMVMMIDLR
jgi:hypothetical protein